MPSYELSLETEPQQEDLAFLDDELNRFNVQQTGRDDGLYLALFLRDGAGRIVGGLYGWTWAGWLEVRTIWLREELRGKGQGTALLQAAEAEAVRRGCEGVFLDSYTFQAPDFYRKLGYQEFGRLDGFPPPHARHFFWKRLA